MNRNQVKGMKDQATGEIKEQVGKLTGDRSTELKGHAREMKGKIQKSLGDAQERVRKDQDDLEAQRMERERMDRK